jgi:hypothetical protein
MMLVVFVLIFVLFLFSLMFAVSKEKIRKKTVKVKGRLTQR